MLSTRSWLLVVLLALFAACGDGVNAQTSFDGGIPEHDAQNIASDFDHLEFEIAPAVPLQGQTFEVVVTAYRSSDDSERLSDYEGSLSLSASVGSLSSGALSQAVSNGRATFSVSLDTSSPNLVLTATDDLLPSITGDSEPFYLSPPGDTASSRQVVINELNWFGNDLASTDEWIEIRNVSGGEINLSEWTLEGAGTSSTPILQFDNGTSLADGDYLVLARRQGPDLEGERSALTGLSNVQIHTMELGNSGEALFLRDVAGTTIDQTPSGAWPAGDNSNDLSMERRDDLTGGGYTDGALAGAWYSWSSLDSVQTSHPDTSDQGTPGSANSNPDLFDHLVFDIQPSSPKANIDFTATITAYSSEDESEVATGYNGSLSLSASDGNLSGDVDEQSVTAGVATLTLRSDLLGQGRTLTASDDIYSHITGTSAAFEVLPEGDPSTLRAVVISEVNYFGNEQADGDEWIELRNISGQELNVSGWIIESAGAGSGEVTLASGTILADGAYLVVADRQGIDSDGLRTSLTGVAGVQVAPISLANGGEHLVLRDVAGTLIDETPDPGWPAGSNLADFSMERRDSVSGGGYTDGALDGAWYTWSSIDGGDTTSSDTSDSGTPGSDNSDPDLFDHFSLSVTPAEPVVGQDFVLSIQAFSSSDDSVALTSYEGTVSLEENTPGFLSGQVASQPIVAGSASLTIQFDALSAGLAITVQDDIYPNIVGTSANIVIRDTGDSAALRDVVISEVNWFGNEGTSNDEWVEIRNRSAVSLDISGWTIDGLGNGAAALAFASGTTLASGGYLVIGDQQGADIDGERTSLTGVVNVQINSSVALSNGGDPLTLRDIDGTLIDQTPLGTFPAGDSVSGRSMERRDDITGGGYTDGSQAGAWYTWNPFANTDTTHVDSSDSGTPGADNSDPAAVLAPLGLPYSTSFETSDNAFENPSPGGFSNVPPTGTAARTGVAIATTDSVTTSLTGRQLQSLHCITLDDDTTVVNARVEAVASSDNGDNQLSGRSKLLWFTDETCSTPHATASTTVTSAALTTSYAPFDVSTTPPLGATHLKIRFEVRDNNAGNNLGDDYAIDDISVSQ